MALLAEKTVSGRELKVKDLLHVEYFWMSEIELAPITGSLYMRLQKYCCDATLLIHEVVKAEGEFANTGKLPDPESTTKIKLDDLNGGRPSLPDGLMRATDAMIAGKVAVGCGYGDVGKPFCAVKNLMETLPEDLSRTVDILVTPTGNKHIIMVDQMRKMKNNAIVCNNIGHFDNNFHAHRFETFPVVEKFTVEKFTDKWVFPDTDSGINVLAEGRLMKLGCATGHPSFVMSFPVVEKFTVEEFTDKWVFPDTDSGINVLAEGRLMKMGCATGHPSFVMSCSFTKQAADINVPVEDFTSLPTTDTEEK